MAPLLTIKFLFELKKLLLSECVLNTEDAVVVVGVIFVFVKTELNEEFELVGDMFTEREEDNDDVDEME